MGTHLSSRDSGGTTRCLVCRVRPHFQKQNKTKKIGVRDHLWVCRDFEASLGYTRPCLHTQYCERISGMVYVNSEAGALAGSLTWGLTGLLDLGGFSTLESGRRAGASAHLPGPTSPWISVAHSAVFTVRKLEHAMSQPSVRIDEASGAVDCLTARDVAVTEKTVSTQGQEDHCEFKASVGSERERLRCLDWPALWKDRRQTKPETLSQGSKKMGSGQGQGPALAPHMDAHNTHVWPFLV